MVSSSLYKYWGKYEKETNAYHPLVYHSLDVAAVGQYLLFQKPSLLCFFSNKLGFSPEFLKSFFPFLLSLHDIGKFSAAFQYKIPSLVKSVYKELRKYVPPNDLHHTSLGYILLSEDFLKGNIIGENLWKIETSPFSPDDSYYVDEVYYQFIKPIVGHHGKPPDFSKEIIIKKYLEDQDIEIAMSFCRDCSQIFFKKMEMQNVLLSWKTLVEKVRVVSWWIAGFAVLCDWLGSNSNYFKFTDNEIPLTEYWDTIACCQAEKIVREINLTVPKTRAEFLDYTLLFPYINEPHCLQKITETLKVSDQPEMFILEDETGSGKTEAALMLVHRLMIEGKADGLYFGLPTMATANSMYERIKCLYRSLYMEGSDPVLILVHSASQIYRAVKDIFPNVKDTDLYYETDNDPSNGGNPNAWFEDNRKKALLAHVGVGTIDQALLSILSTRYQALRLIGLHRKVLIIDEVHASDVYMHELTKVLLEFHAVSGGYAILLSATLPQKMRLELIGAWKKGLGYNDLNYKGQLFLSDSYPMITKVNNGNISEFPVQQIKSRNLIFSHIYNEDDIIAKLFEISEKGLCSVWIRNTVADAKESYLKMKNSLPVGNLILFHAKYAICDRLTIENKVINSFGKGSSGETRKGKIVIATQVIEQSLDLDFDFMISDLAPIDLLIQRAGRLKRHKRDKAGNPVPYLDERGDSELFVFCPPLPENEIEVDTDWYKSKFPKGAGVYQDHALLWLTAKLIKENPVMRIPEDIRNYVEAVFSEKKDDKIPSTLLKFINESEGKRGADISLSYFNSIDLNSGYEASNFEWQEDLYIPTRLGDPMVTLRLGCFENGEIKPISSETIFSWDLSEVTIRSKYISKEYDFNNGEIEEKIARIKKEWGSSSKYYILVVLFQHNDGYWTGKSYNENNDVVNIKYSNELGLDVLI
ncbi:CRISPR-associated helicase Cas3' [Thermoproteota archaeon]